MESFGMDRPQLSVRQACSFKKCTGCKKMLRIDKFSTTSKVKNKINRKTYVASKCRVCTNSKKFGMNSVDIDQMLEFQQHGCAFCKAPLNNVYHIDHSHAREGMLRAHHNKKKLPPNLMKQTVRGLLCRDCNIYIFTTRICKILNSPSECTAMQNYANKLYFTQTADDEVAVGDGTEEASGNGGDSTEEDREDGEAEEESNRDGGGEEWPHDDGGNGKKNSESKETEDGGNETEDSEDTTGDNKDDSDGADDGSGMKDSEDEETEDGGNETEDSEGENEAQDKDAKKNKEELAPVTTISIPLTEAALAIIKRTMLQMDPKVPRPATIKVDTTGTVSFIGADGIKQEEEEMACACGWIVYTKFMNDHLYSERHARRMRALPRDVADANRQTLASPSEASVSRVATRVSEALKIT